jgi:hypothetical protein
MTGILEYVPRRAGLYDFSRPHYYQRVAKAADNAKVVADKYV